MLLRDAIYDNLTSTSTVGSVEMQVSEVHGFMQVIEAVVKEIGGDRVGLRLSPYSVDFLDCMEPDVESTVKLNAYLLEQLNKFNLAYVHIVSARTAGPSWPTLSSHNHVY